MYRDQEQREFARWLRNEATPAETRLWHFLRAGRLGVKFRRQAAIGACIVDFICFSHCLIVELDGPQHVEAKGKEHDARRTAWLASRGFRVIRFRNQALEEDIWLVVEEIRRALRDCELGTKQPPPQPSPPRGGSRTKAKNGAGNGEKKGNGDAARFKFESRPVPLDLDRGHRPAPRLLGRRHRLLARARLYHACPR
jgi:very-short-patch-repair endonuclease